jgi:hypothetical protein
VAGDIRIRRPYGVEDGGQYSRKVNEEDVCAKASGELRTRSANLKGGGGVVERERCEQ